MMNSLFLGDAEGESVDVDFLLAERMSLLTAL